jgi:hypothetical protein
MEQITHYSTFLKGILDANPWIWHGIQVYMLFNLILRTKLIRKSQLLEKIILPFKYLNFFLTVTILFLFDKIVLWGLIIYLFIFISNIVSSFKIKKKYFFVYYVNDIFNYLLICASIFSLSEEINLKYKLILLLIWLYYLQKNIFYIFNHKKYSKINDTISFEGIGPNAFFLPMFIGLTLIPFCWYIWLYVIIILFESEEFYESYPKYFLTNNFTLIDNWKNNSRKNILFFKYAVIFIVFWGFNHLTFLFLGLFQFFLIIFQNSKFISSNPFEDYDSLTFTSGNYNYLSKVSDKKKFLLLIQRISIKISDKLTYGVLVSPYEYVIVKHNSIKHLNELIPLSHHLILVDGGEESNKIIRIENDFTNFLGRVDTVIDYFFIANQTIDKYSEPIEIEYANCIRERIAVKQAIIDEKAFVLDDNLEEEEKTIDTFINSINTESVRINMLVREYFKENTIDYEQLQSELINKGPFEINTLLRQMREGGSVPSRFVDALSIAEVAARYLFSLVNEVNIDLNKNENSVEDRNKFYSKLSFGPCVGFLRGNVIGKKNRDLNEFEKTVKELLEIKYTDSDNFERLRKYLITDLHYDKKVSDEPTLFDLFNYMAYIRNKTRGHGTPSKVEFEFYVTLDLISIFIVNCISKIEIETFSRQTINKKEWLLYYNAGGNVVLHPLEPNENLEYWKDSFDWKYLDKMEDAKKQIDETNQSVYFKIKHQEEIHWIKAETYFKCKEGIIYMYDGINNNEAEWISFTTGAVIRPYRIN